MADTGGTGRKVKNNNKNTERQTLVVLVGKLKIITRTQKGRHWWYCTVELVGKIKQ